MRSTRDGCNGGVEQGSVQVGHDTLAGKVFVDQNVIGVFGAENCWNMGWRKLAKNYWRIAVYMYIAHPNCSTYLHRIEATAALPLRSFHLDAELRRS